MKANKHTEKESSRFDTWIKVVPIFIALVGLCFTGYQISIQKNGAPTEEKKTWEKNRQTYLDMVDLAGRITAAKNNDSLLKVLNSDFERYYNTKMKFVEEDDTDVVMVMMMLKKDVRNTLEHKADYYQPEKLEKTCKRLSVVIREAIRKGDAEY